MSALHIHLITVHFPIVGCLAALVLLVLSQIYKNELLFKIACSFLLVCGAVSAVAYYSGPLAYETLLEKNLVEKSVVENHAVLGQAAFVAMMVLAVVALSAFFQYWQGEVPGKLHRWVLIIATVVIFYLFAWAAHLGGEIRRPELRGSDIPIFMDLQEKH